MFESIFTSTAQDTISIGPAMLGLFTALVLGLLIGIAYMTACKKDGYNKNFIIGLVLLPAIVSVVIFLIGSNVARAFSMAGAFALVRFRSAPGNAKDIAVVFFTMAAGLACGKGAAAARPQPNPGSERKNGGTGHRGGEPGGRLSRDRGHVSNNNKSDNPAYVL